MNFKTKTAILTVAFSASLSIAGVAQADDGTSKTPNMVQAQAGKKVTESATSMAFTQPRFALLYGFGSLGNGTFKNSVNDPNSLSFEMSFNGTKPQQRIIAAISYTRFKSKAAATAVRATSITLGFNHELMNKGRVSVAAGLSAGLGRFTSDIAGNTGTASGLVGSANLYMMMAGLPHNLQFVAKLSYGGTTADVGSLASNKAGLLSYHFGLEYNPSTKS